MKQLPVAPLTFDPAEPDDGAVIRQVNREFASRAGTGGWFYAAVAASAWSATDLPAKDFSLLIIATLLTAALVAARLWLVHAEHWFGAAAPILWRHLLGSVLIGTGGVWGAVLAYVIATRDMASSTTSLMIAITVGLAAGMLHVAAPILRLTTLYLAMMVAPAALAAVYVGGAAAWGFAAIFGVFFFVFLSLARSVHNEYWEHFRDRKLLEVRAEQLAAARDATEAASKAKLEFLANVSHELRTPMNGVIGMTSLALATEMNGEQRDLIQTAKDSAESLLTLLNDLLDFSKMDSGKMQLQPIPVEMKPFFELTLKPFRSQTQTRRIELRLEVDASLPEALRVDPLRLKQVVVNLVSNAVKFTLSGHVALQVRYDASAKMAHFCVADTGIGIDASKQRAIFDAFTQADGSVTRRFGGTGLGLAICSKIVALWGGEIHVTSEPGRGSEFRFSMPAEACTAPAPEKAEPISALTARPAAASPVAQDGSQAAPTRQLLRILIAEDNRVNQKVAEQALAKLGHQTAIAANGRIAVDMAFAEVFDLILMDVQMPEMSGLEATEEIRRREQGTGRRIPIVAVTANAMTGDRERCLEAGMDGYLAKPIRLDELRAITANPAALVV